MIRFKKGEMEEKLKLMLEFIDSVENEEKVRQTDDREQQEKTS